MIMEVAALEQQQSHDHELGGGVGPGDGARRAAA